MSTWALSLPTVIGGASSVLFGLGVVEVLLHRRNLARIPIRIHVNGTRGKSSVTRLIAAALREGGLRTFAKTTGTLARVILPDGSELPVFRPAGANIMEQKRIVATALAYRADALVIECMALQPELQVLSERGLVRATHGVITNARPDHLDVMGPGPRDVALALAGMTPVRGKLFTREQQNLDVLERAAKDRQTELIAVDDSTVEQIPDETLAQFSYTEHRENVALALSVAQSVGVSREVALRGMTKTQPDPGALTVHELDFFGRRIVFVNAFAANDPVSTGQLWHLMVQRFPDVDTRVAIFNCRSDRADRSLQLAEALRDWTAPNHLVLMGSGTYAFARSFERHGDAAKVVFVEGYRTEEIFERVIGLSGRSALIVGMGNIGGQGLPLVSFFANRAPPSDAVNGS
ncbi:MAG: poly-gamma-glutamate synthase PgsB [Polyangiaceae bacterium]|nr:poly-gamma-glutamate synthase PgsB [Polyangiaceae bacterium]